MQDIEESFHRAAWRQKFFAEMGGGEMGNCMSGKTL